MPQHRIGPKAKLKQKKKQQQHQKNGEKKTHDRIPH